MAEIEEGDTAEGPPAADTISTEEKSAENDDSAPAEESGTNDAMLEEPAAAEGETAATAVEEEEAAAAAELNDAVDTTAEAEATAEDSVVEGEEKDGNGKGSEGAHECKKVWKCFGSLHL